MTGATATIELALTLLQLILAASLNGDKASTQALEAVGVKAVLSPSGPIAKKK